MFNNKSWAEIVARVRKMSWDELRVRGYQEIAKRSDLVRSRIGLRFVKNSSNQLPGYRGRFFFASRDVQRIIDFLRQRLPDTADSIVHQAEQICRHRFDLLGYQGIDYGERIDWHLDALHGKRAPQRPWFQIRYLDFNEVGDAKITWELNRHQHLVTLAKAYRLTGRTQYALELFEQWYEWQRQNPYPIGINWASSLEVAFRSMSWLWVFHLLEKCPVVPAKFPSDLDRALTLSGRHIERFLSTYFSPNTHLLGEGAGLFFIGTLWPRSQAFQRWQRKGWQIVLQEAQRQVRPDGMHFEQSTYYHTYALDLFLHARMLASLNALAIPDEFDRTIEKMLEVLSRLGNSGSLPRLGDDDGGRVFDPRRNQLEHMLDPLALGALLFSRDDFKAVVGDIREETIWLSGVDAAGRFDSLFSRRPAPVSFALDSSGIHVMSSSEPAQQLVINAGPVEEGRNGHRHADALSMHLAIASHSMLIDPGTFTYVDRSGERDRFRGTPAHNTLNIDGLSQGGTDGPFGWQALRSASINSWTIGNSFDFFEGSHSGYSRLADPVEHRRSIFYWKPQFWLVRDVVEGTGVHQIGVHWQFAEGSLSRIPDGAMYRSERGPMLAVLFASNRSWMHNGCIGSYSPVYGIQTPAPHLRCTTETALPVELVSLLLPISTGVVDPGDLKVLGQKSENASISAYQYCAGAVQHLFVFSSATGSWRIGPWSSDARFFFCAGSCGIQPDHFVMCDGSYLALDGRQIVAAHEPLKYAEFSSAGAKQTFHCSDPLVISVDRVVTSAGNTSRLDTLTAV